MEPVVFGSAFAGGIFAYLVPVEKKVIQQAHAADKISGEAFRNADAFEVKTVQPHWAVSSKH